MKEENYIAFENYISKSLSDEEVLAFEEKLSSDSEFKKDFETYKELTEFLEYSYDEEKAAKEFEANLKTISNNYFEKQEHQVQPLKKSRTFKISQLAIAATVVVLLGLFIFNRFSAPGYEDYSEHGVISLSVRGNVEDVVIKAQNAFNEKNYKDAEVHFSEILKTYSDNEEVKLYKAISQIEQDKFEEAEAILKQIASGKSAYKSEALWYAALSKLKQKDNKACIELLKSLSEDTIHYEKAQKLIDKLD
ncbi:tol-pal system YbgF family protein [uncultured Winogradskyella sp.]|uniref:tetratricopeptide repeat protein n=1 Tax=uncultured Winogradskyella sp. TaxID=395353 RepID=UPI0026304A2B|nr:tetratricopeptide repeat protein [uncultured Winogradskyella sp.]